MKEAYGDIWELAPDYDAVVITTNGYVKKNGEAVMGRGVAKEAKERYHWLPERLGYWLQEMGNIPGIWTLDWGEHHLITLPVKPRYGANGEMGWKAKADIDLIKNSIPVFLKHVDDYEINKVIMPRPGCGNGGLKWEDVKPVIEPLLDDRFTVVTWHPTV